MFVLFYLDYSETDKQDFIDMFLRKVRESYSSGQYKIFSHDKTGIKINCYITILGQGIKRGHSYDIRSGWKVFPDGKLVANTIFAGRQKKNEIF